MPNPQQSHRLTAEEFREIQAAGPLVEEMRADRMKAIAALHSDSPVLQRVALRAISNSADAEVPLCEFISASVGDVRGHAISTLALVRCKSFGRPISETIAEYLLNPETDDDARAHIYNYLRFSVCSPEARDTRDTRVERLAIEEVDPEVVKRCIAADRLSPGLQPKPRIKAMQIYVRGVEAIRAQRFTEAEQLLRQAAATYRTGLPYQTLGELYERLGRLDDAVAALSLAVEIEPRMAMLYRLRARIYRKAGHSSLAQADETRADALENSN